ncbi:hypothetical protein GH714_002865 [Hevea brasiliensis]|uniref:Uncharacterized protein n=1 Tax=Hevea brasiliensis TaxID=3981 RepID=A0A6A6LWG9_HEVBR|nr:hypothetical protein GH714_030633 [Hevea brasiliensis]KAF2323875.1 hypothetical protein GH714_002865 [Hevea brasiliensis]
MASSQIVKENDGGEGCSLDGKRLYCKRKTPKDEQLGARLVFALEAAPVMHQPSSVAASVLGAGARPGDIHQTIGVAGESQYGSCIDQNPFANDPSNSSSLIISSGIAEYIVEENDGGEGCSLNEAAPVMHQPSSVAASGLGAGVGLSDIHQTIGVAGEAQHSQRNIHMRRASEDEQLGLLFIPSGSCINQNLFANDPSNSNSLVISSRIAEYIVEENDSGEGCSLDGMRLYCKKRAPQDEQLGTRCVLALEAAPIMHQPSSVVASGLGAGVGPSDIHQTIEYIVEENDGAEGFSLDGKHLYCKRRAPEDEQLGIGLVLALEAALVMHQPSSVAANGLGADAGPSNIHQTIGVVRETQNSQRNIRLIRATEDEQLVEENDGGEGCSLDGRRLYYKRRAPEDEQLGIRLVLALETAPIMHQPSSVAVSGLGAGVGPSNIHQTIGVAGEAQHSQRNIRLRKAPEDKSAGPSDTHQTIGEVGEAQHSQRTVNHQDFLPTNLATWTTRNSQPQLPAQLAIHLSFDCVPKTSSMTAIVQPTPPMQQPMPVSYSLESMQPFQWNDVTRSRTGLPLTSTYTLNGGDASLVEGTSRNTQRNGMLPSEFQRGYLEHMLRNLNVVPETNSPRNIAFNSRNSSTTHDHQSSAPIQSPQHNISQEYE